MTVKGLKKILEGVEANNVTYAGLRKKNVVVAIDALWFLWRSFKGIKANLTASDGRSTSAYIPIMAAIREFGPNNQIWVFDNETSNPEKKEEIERRKEARESAQISLFSMLNDDTITIAEKSKATVNASALPRDVVPECKKILDMFGVRWIDAPVGVEGECLAAWLTQNGYADAVYSADGDCLPFGAKQILTPVPKKSGSFRIVSLLDVHRFITSKILVNYHARVKKMRENYTMKLDKAKLDGDMDAIAQFTTDLNDVPPDLDDADPQEILKIICMCLGTDWDPAGAKGIGPSTIVSQFNKAYALWLSDAYSELREASSGYSVKLPQDYTPVFNRGDVSVNAAGYLMNFDKLIVYLTGADFKQNTVDGIVKKFSEARDKKTTAKKKPPTKKKPAVVAPVDDSAEMKIIVTPVEKIGNPVVKKPRARRR